MNVLLASPWPLDFRGGVTVIARTLALGLRQAGDQVCYLLPTHGKTVERQRHGDLNVFTVPMRLPVVKGHALRSRLAFALFLPLTCLRLARILRRERIQIVNVHYFSEHWLYFIFLRTFLPFRFVVSVHGTDIQGEEGSQNVKIMKRWHRNIDAIVFCSEASRQGLAPYLELRKKSIVILNSIDLSTMPIPLPECQRENYVICSGHLQKHKGQDILIRAFSMLPPELGEVRLVIVGEGPMRGLLEKLIRDLHLEGRVELRGGVAREQAIEVMRQATLTCVPSRRETFGLVLLESMALEVPVVATRVGGIPEVIRDEIDGLLVSAEDAGELAKGIARILLDHDLRATMVSRAAQRVRDVFHSDRLVSEYRNHLRSLLPAAAQAATGNRCAASR